MTTMGYVTTLCVLLFLLVIAYSILCWLINRSLPDIKTKYWDGED